MSYVGVFLLARNEEKNIKKTLTALINQDLKPQKIILINDNSNDKTKEIAKRFTDVEVIDFPLRHPNWLLSPQFAKVYNFGLSQLKKSGNYDYIMKLDSDHILPQDYLSKIISEMNKNENIVSNKTNFHTTAEITRIRVCLLDPESVSFLRMGTTKICNCQIDYFSNINRC